MPYKKRVIIFLSAMLSVFVVLSIFYVAQVRSNVADLDSQDLKPEGFDDVKKVFKGSNLKNMFEFEE